MVRGRGQPPRPTSPLMVVLGVRCLVAGSLLAEIEFSKDEVLATAVLRHPSRRSASTGLEAALEACGGPEGADPQLELGRRSGRGEGRRGGWEAEVLQDPAGDDGLSDKEEGVGRGVMRPVWGNCNSVLEPGLRFGRVSGPYGFGSKLGAGSNRTRDGRS